MTSSIRDMALYSYYDHCFPSQLLWRWLSVCDMNGLFSDTYVSRCPSVIRWRKLNVNAEDVVFDINKKDVVALAEATQIQREIAFEYADSVMRRHLRFGSIHAFRSELLTNNPPITVHLGARYIYNEKDEKNRSSDNIEHRELIFDVDMNEDYDNFIDRSKCGCKGKKQVCVICWLILQGGMIILNNILSRDFGFKHVYFFYSGRRGFHCWVTDHRARLLTREARKCILEYIYKPYDPKQRSKYAVKNGRIWVVKSEKEQVRYSTSRRRDISVIQRSWDIPRYYKQDVDAIMPLFRRVCVAFELCQGINGYTKMVKQFLFSERDQSILLSESIEDVNICMFGLLLRRVREYMRPFTKPLPSEQVSNVSSLFAQTITMEPSYQIVSLIPRIVLYYMIPRVDVNVTTEMRHLAKSPFSVHPATRQIAVPVSLDVDCEFDPSRVPTVDMLLNEIDSLSVDKMAKAWEHTSIASFVRQFVADINTNTNKNKTVVPF